VKREKKYTSTHCDNGTTDIKARKKTLHNTILIIILLLIIIIIMANNYRATVAPFVDAGDYTVDPTTEITNTDLDFGGGDVIGMLALGCFSAGFVSLLLCSFGADHAQTSLKTVMLMSLATLLSFPLPIYTSTAGDIVQGILYSLNVVMMFYLAHARFIQKESTFKTTYDPKLDSFPHFLLCFLPAVGITISIFLFLEYIPDGNGERTLAACQKEMGGLYCGLLVFRLSSAMLYMLAFIPQVYVVFKIWAGHSQSAGFEKVVYFKIKLFLALMFASFLLRSLWWLLWANANQLWTDEVFFIFFSANAVAALVPILPWLVRGTCMQLCQCTSCSCCIRPPKRDDPGANAHIRVNTGQSNDNAIEQAEEEKKRKSWFTTPVSTSISSSFSPKNKTPTTVLDEHDAPPEEERNVGVILPEGLGSSSNGGGSPPSWQRPMSSFAGSTSSTTNGYNTNSANVLSPASVPGTSPSVATYYSPTAATAGAAAGAQDRPDWLRED
jgi:hypothetical protein